MLTPHAATAPPARLRDTHGTRNCYVDGCRCDDCRAANAAYHRRYRHHPEGAGWGPRVAARRARAHIKRLAREGVGAGSVAHAAELSKTTVAEIRNGITRVIYRRTEQLILRITPDHADDGCLVDAAPSWALIAELRDEGYTASALARLLGYSGRALQLHRKRITKRNAYRIRVLHEALTSDERRPIPRTRPQRPRIRRHAPRSKP
jgi:hypothetical protein